MEHPKVFVLPDSAKYPDPTAFLKFPHPRTGSEALYLPHETHGLLELQTIQPPEGKARSWFIDDKCIEDGRLHLLTPFDVSFLLASLLNKQAHFLPFEDLMDTCVETALKILQTNYVGENFDDVVESLRIQMNKDINVVAKLPCSKAAIDRICDKQVVGDLETYRLSKPHLQNYLKRKVEKLSEPSLFGSIITFQRFLAKNGLAGEGVTPDEEILSQARVYISIDFLSAYLENEAQELLRKAFDTSKYEKYIQGRSEAFELSSEYHPGLNKKENLNPKQAEINNMKKAKASRGIEALKKVNTKGMKKMTDFFTKK